MARALQEFEYIEPDSLEATIAALQSDDALPFAGGVDLVLEMRLRHVKPGKLVSLRKLAGLSHISVDADGGLRIGALTKLSAVANDDNVRSGWVALSEAVGIVGTPQVRNMSTLAGNLCAASPLSDISPVLLAYNAEATVVGPAGERRLSIAALVPSLGRTGLEAGEIVTEISIPPPQAGSVAKFTRFLKPRSAVGDLPKVSVAAVISVDGGLISSAAICLGGVDGVAFRASAIETALNGSDARAASVADAIENSGQVWPLLTNNDEIEEYRHELAQILCADTITEAADQAGAS